MLGQLIFNAVYIYFSRILLFDYSNRIYAKTTENEKKKFVNNLILETQNTQQKNTFLF